MKILLINRNNTNTGVFESISLSLRFTLPLKYYLDKKILINKILVMHEEHDDIKLAMNWADRIVINRGSSVRLLLLMNEKLWKKTIYDVDDNIFKKARYAKNLFNNVDESVYADYIMNSSVVTVSNKILYNILRAKYNLKNILILPISIMPEPMEDYKNNNNNNNILMVNGDSIKLYEHKQQFLNEVNLFISKNPSIRFDYIGDISSDIKKIKNINYMQKIPYTSLSKLLRVRKYKCALVPLGDDEDFDDCKSAIKYFQNAIFGIPGLYSNKKVYSDFINNGINGVLVDNQYGCWLNELESIYSSDLKCREICHNAYDDVSTNYTFDSMERYYREIF